VASTCQRKLNWPLSGCGQGHVTHYLNSGPPSISETDKDRHLTVW